MGVKESTLEKNREVDVAILNFWPFKNYGGVLVAYALQKILKKLGYSSKLINWQFSAWREKYSGSFVEKFANKYLNFTAPYYDCSELANNMNNLADTFIVGADCVWSPVWYKKSSSLYFFSFVDSSKKKISYAPSFMNEQLDYPPDLLLINKYYLSRFDSISVREDSGLKILKDIFNVEATQVLDPTLLLNKNDYNEIISRNNASSDKDYVYIYLIHQDEALFQDLKQKISSLVDNKKIIILRQQESEKSVSDWMDLIVNSKVLITNSYHACCFAILFNIPFYVYMQRELADYSRHESLMRILGLENRIKYNADDFNNDMLFDPIDWAKVNIRLEAERTRSLKWLKDALEKPKDASNINPVDPVLHHLNKDIFALEKDIFALEKNIFALEKNIFALNQHISILENQLENQKVYSQDLFDILNYRKYIIGFWKYRFLKNFVFGKKKKKYKYKQKAYKFKIDYIKNLMSKNK